MTLTIRSLHAADQILSLLSSDRARHVYAIGDLDPFFFDRTVWLAGYDEGRMQVVLLLYVATSPPTLVAFSTDHRQLRRTIKAALPLLPAVFYAHVETGAEQVFEPFVDVTLGGHVRMRLAGPDRVNEGPADTDVFQLDIGHLGELNRLYHVAYPNNWFDARMLETGYYRGLRIDGQLAGVAGVHVVAQPYGVAALGNITTHPQFRRRGVSGRVTAALCRDLLAAGIDEICLNVAAENSGARALYRTLGFQDHCHFHEFEVRRAFEADSSS